jgi:hypothetical protein
MELFIPSLVALLIGVAAAFFVIPNIAPDILMIASAIVLAAAIYFHYTRFGVAEYERATWVTNLKNYSGYILFGFVILAGYGLVAMNRTQGGGPALNLPAIGGGVGNVVNTVRSRLDELLRKGRISS